MARGSKSQWEFGELFPEKELRQVLSVGELTTRIKRQLETQFKDVWVSGEISNYRLQSSGHAYFVLKDASAQLSCVLFRGQSGVVREQLRDGVKVRLNGEITVYEPRGQYQLRVSGVEIEGIGALQIAFERLKQKLSAEGLFATERKRLIPLYPRRIGIVTSPTGAALQDIVNVVQRRDPQLEIVLVSSRVQGSEAAAEIAAGISRLNRWSSSGNSPLDLILVTRGGGSLEDLWAFNEEVVARAIAASDLPVISAVGHEIDFTIADFVADLRAATPSAAAEIITQSIMESRTFVGDASSGLSLLARRFFRRVSQTGEELRGRLMRRHPRRRIEEQGQRLDDLVESLRRNLFASGRRSHLEIRHQLQRLRSARPSVRVREIDRRFVERLRQLRNNLGRQLLARQEQIRQRDQALQLLSPQNVLNRGYSMTLDVTTNEVIRNAKNVKVGDKVRTRVQLGEFESEVIG